MGAGHDLIVNDLGGCEVEEKRTFVEGYPDRELTIYLVAQRLYVLRAFAPKRALRPENFSTFLNSFRLRSKLKP